MFLNNSSLFHVNKTTDGISNYFDQIINIQEQLPSNKDDFHASKLTFIIMGVFSSFIVPLGFFLVGIGSTPMMVATGVSIAPIILGHTSVFLGFTSFLSAFVMGIITLYRAHLVKSNQKEKILLELKTLIAIKAIDQTGSFENQKINKIISYDEKFPPNKNLENFVNTQMLEDLLEKEDSVSPELKDNFRRILHEDKYPLITDLGYNSSESQVP